MHTSSIIKNIAAIAIIGLISSQANAATSGSVVITGTVSEVVAVSVTANQNSFSITPGVAIDNQNIAGITVNSNDQDGYTVSLSSTRDGSKLANGDGDEFMAYTVSYNGSSDISLSTSATVVETTTGQTSGALSRSLTLDIAGSQSVGRSAEAYSDTITVVIAGK